MSTQKTDKRILHAMFLMAAVILAIPFFSAIFELKNVFGYAGSKTPMAARILGIVLWAAAFIFYYRYAGDKIKWKISFGVSMLIFAFLLLMGLGCMVGFNFQFDNPY